MPSGRRAQWRRGLADRLFLNAPEGRHSPAADGGSPRGSAQILQESQKKRRRLGLPLWVFWSGRRVSNLRAVACSRPSESGRLRAQRRLRFPGRVSRRALLRCERSLLGRVLAATPRRVPPFSTLRPSNPQKQEREAQPPSGFRLERATGLEPTRRSVLAAVGVRPLARATAPTVPGAGLSPGVVALRTLPPRSRSRGNASACPALLDPFAFESAETRKGGTASLFGFSGAGDGSRTRDLKLGKLALYRLSYARADQNDSAEAEPGSRPPETPPRGAPPLRGRAGIGTMRWCPARRDGEPE